MEETKDKIEEEEEIKKEEESTPPLPLSNIAGLDAPEEKEEEEEETPPPVEEKKEEKKEEEKEEENLKDKIEEEEGKKKEEEKEEEEKKKPDWESEDNPYKKRHKATSEWGSQVNQAYQKLKEENTELQANITDVRKGLELDEFKYKAPEKPQEETNFIQKLKVSEQAAVEFYGEGDANKGKEELEKLLGPDSGFPQLLQTNAAVRARFMNADSPILEAVKIMKEKVKLDFFGSDSITEVKAKMRKELEAENDTRRKNKERLQHGPRGLPPGRSDKTGNDKKEKKQDNSLSKISGLG